MPLGGTMYCRFKLGSSATVTVNNIPGATNRGVATSGATTIEAVSFVLVALAFAVFVLVTLALAVFVLTTFTVVSGVAPENRFMNSVLLNT